MKYEFNSLFPWICIGMFQICNFKWPPAYLALFLWFIQGLMTIISRKIWVSFGSGKGVLPDGTKTLNEPMLTSNTDHQQCMLSLVVKSGTAHFSPGQGVQNQLTNIAILRKMYISSTTSVFYLSPLYMNCMSLGNKHCFIVIVIVIVKIIIWQVN